MRSIDQQPALPRLYVFSGAGLSAESGISTFRARDGIWTTSKVEEVCDFTTWRENRAAVFDFYNARIREYRNASPNEAHDILARWQREWGPERVILITQNIDDLLERAGAQLVTHLHGDMHSLLCTACNFNFPKSSGLYDSSAACPTCGQVEPVKPGVVFFNEEAPAYVELRRLRMQMTSEDVFLAIGTTFEVVDPKTILPYGRRVSHARNFLIDPAPRFAWVFGHVRKTTATKGLRGVEGAISRLMNATGATVAAPPARNSSDGERH